MFDGGRHRSGYTGNSAFSITDGSYFQLRFFHSQQTPSKRNIDADAHIRKNSLYHYNVTLRIFNESMDLCLPEPDMTGIEMHDSQLFDAI